MKKQAYSELKILRDYDRTTLMSTFTDKDMLNKILRSKCVQDATVAYIDLHIFDTS